MDSLLSAYLGLALMSSIYLGYFQIEFSGFRGGVKVSEDYRCH